MDAKQLLAAIRNAMQADRDLLGPEEDARIHAGMAALAAAEQGDDVERIRAATDELGRSTDAFAARRMNRSIRKALAGQRIDALVSEDEPAQTIAR
ncbi:chaperone protein HscA [mine drainage metagenome]|uniref:Chaperone protein HscA n=1 Tax=mine drainage metagenome TaxID=410659 RepID=A0A1J5NXZ8_9ZZZZ